MQQVLHRTGTLWEVSAGEQDIPGANKYYCYKIHGWSWTRV